MDPKEEFRLHVAFFLLFVCSLYLDPVMLKILPAWKPPPVTFFSVVVAVLWLAVFTIRRLRLASDRMKVLQDRVERVERRCRELEDRDLPHSGVER